MVDVKTTIKEYLEENGYDGLYNGEIQCCCKKDELFICGEVYLDCRAGYLAQCPDWVNDGSYCIGGTKGKKCEPDEFGEYECGIEAEDQMENEK
jgi:hypothetical protein